MHLVAGWRNAPERDPFAKELHQLAVGGFAFGVEALPGGVGDDLGYGFATAKEDEALAGFHLGDAAGEVLIGFAERDLAHGGSCRDCTT